MELFSPGHFIPLLIIVAVLFFGWKQLPDMSRSLGRSLRIFKTEIKGMTEDDKAREQRDETPAAAQAPRELPKAEVVLNKATAAPRPRPTPGRPAPRPAANSQSK